MKGLHWSSKVRTEEAKNQIEKKNRSKLKETYITTNKNTWSKNKPKYKYDYHVNKIPRL